MAESVFLEGTGFHTGKSCAIDLLNSNPNHEDLTPSADSQGENQPVMPQVCMPDEGNSHSSDAYIVNHTSSAPREHTFDFKIRGVFFFFFKSKPDVELLGHSVSKYSITIIIICCYSLIL